LTGILPEFEKLFAFLHKENYTTEIYYLVQIDYKNLLVFFIITVIHSFVYLF